MNILSRIVLASSLITTLVLLAGCSPEVGSKAWCEDMEQKPKGEWSANEGTDYAKNCIFK